MQLVLLLAPMLELVQEPALESVLFGPLFEPVLELVLVVPLFDLCLRL